MASAGFPVLPLIGSTFCSVRILAPDARQWLFSTNGAPGDRSSQGTVVQSGDLMRVSVHKDLSQACGTFTLDLAPLLGPDGRYWDQRIPQRSLVFIFMDRPGPEGASPDPTVMVGFVDVTVMQESFLEAAPHRTVQVSGREISCLLLDAKRIFHPLLVKNESYGTMTVQTVFGTKDLATTGPVQPILNGEPIALLTAMLNLFLLQGGPTPVQAQGPVQPGAVPPTVAGPVQKPLISLDIPHMPLSQVLDPNYAAWNTFLPGVRITNAQLPQGAGSLWNDLHLVIDRLFQEFFSRVEDGVCKLFFRGKPFLHQHISSGTRFKSATKEPTLQTLTLDPADILSHTRTRDTSSVYNYFEVLPRGFTDLTAAPNLRDMIAPAIITDPRHPSFPGRYGLRPLQHVTPYLSPFVQGKLPSGQTPVATTPLQTNPNLTGQAATYAPMAAQIATQEGLPRPLIPWFVASIEQESQFDPNATHTNPNGSRDEGIAQFHKPYPQGITLPNPFDPVASLHAAVQYWNQLRALPWIGDDPRLILSGYNIGPEATRTAGVRDANGVPLSAVPHVTRVTALVPKYAGYAGAPTAAPVLAQAPQQSQAPAPAPEDVDVIRTAQQWSAIAMSWYDFGGELFSGTLVVRGHPRWRVGHRLLTWDVAGEWEGYIEAVSQSYDGSTGRFISTIRYTRGWYLGESAAQRVWTEARTTIVDASGGPPSVDPQSGEPAADGGRYGPGKGVVEVIVHEDFSVPRQ